MNVDGDVPSAAAVLVVVVVVGTRRFIPESIKRKKEEGKLRRSFGPLR